MTRISLCTFMWGFGSLLILPAFVLPAGCESQMVSGFGLSGPRDEGTNDAETADARNSRPAGSVARHDPETHDALVKNIAALETGIAWLDGVPGYRATFYKHEMIGGSLGDPKVCDLKLRRVPFSVYMKFHANKEEVLYVDGTNDNKLLVHHVGFKSMLGDLRLTPDCALALTESRYPITQVGMANLAKKLLEYRKRDLSSPGQCKVRMVTGEKFEDRDCIVFVAEYTSPDADPVYRKSVCYIDREHSIPLAIRNYGWPEGQGTPPDDSSTLIEQYEYRNLAFGPLADFEFSAQNKSYAFKN